VVDPVGRRFVTKSGGFVAGSKINKGSVSIRQSLEHDNLKATKPHSPFTGNNILIPKKRETILKRWGDVKIKIRESQ